MEISNKYPLAVIPGGNLFSYRYALLITQKFPSGNDSERRMCRNTIYLLNNVLTPNLPESLPTPTLPPQLATILQNHSDYDFVPLLELVTCHPPDGYEAFFNHVAELVCRHLHYGEWDNGYLVRIPQELFCFRDAFRGMRGGAGWT